MPVSCQDLLQKIHSSINFEARKKNKRPTDRPKYKEMFKRFDLDGTGVIDDSELRQGLESFGFNFDQEQAGQVLTVFDPKGDGTVDKKEFMKFCENTDVSKAVQHTLEVKAKALESKKLKDDELQVHILESMLIYPNPNPA